MAVWTAWYDQTAYVRARARAGLHVIDEVQRFRMLACCLLCSVCVSLVYAFDLFTTEFSLSFGLSAGDLSTISTVGTVFCCFVLPYGVIYDYAGPFVLLLLAALTGLVGCLGLALVVQRTIVGNMATITVFYAIMNVCSGLFDAATIVTLAEAFPRNRGLVLALTKTITGLGASVLSSISAHVFDNHTSGFIYFIMCLSVAVAVLAMLVVALPPHVMNGWRRRGKAPQHIAALQSLRGLYEVKFVPLRRICVGYAVVLTMVVYFAVVSPVVAYVPVSRPVRVVFGVVTMMLCACFGLMALPLRCLGGVDEAAPPHTTELAAAMTTLATSAELSSSSSPLSSSSADDSGEEAVVCACGRGGAAAAAAAAAAGTAVATPASDTKATATASVSDTHTMAMVTVDASDDAVCRRDAVTTATLTAAGDDSDSHGGDGAALPTRVGLLQSVLLDMHGPQDPCYATSLRETLLSADIWLILFMFVLQNGLGTIITYNGNTVYIALSGEHRSAGVAALYTAFLGVGSAVGRMVLGLYETYVQSQPAHKRRLLITHALPCISLMAMVSGVLVLVLPGKMMLLPYILIYLEEGMQQGVRALIYPSLFLYNRGILYNMSFFSMIIAVIVFNRAFFGSFIDRQHRILGYAAGTDCAERACVQTPMIVVTATAALACVLSVLIHVRYSRFVAKQRALQACRVAEVSEDSATQANEPLHSCT